MSGPVVVTPTAFDHPRPPTLRYHHLLVDDLCTKQQSARRDGNVCRPAVMNRPPSDDALCDHQLRSVWHLSETAVRRKVVDSTAVGPRVTWHSGERIQLDETRSADAPSNRQSTFKVRTPICAQHDDRRTTEHAREPLQPEYSTHQGCPVHSAPSQNP